MKNLLHNVNCHQAKDWVVVADQRQWVLLILDWIAETRRGISVKLPKHYRSELKRKIEFLNNRFKKDKLRMQFLLWTSRRTKEQDLTYHG